ncbi:MAG: hypothetical protein AAB368_14245 [bacterium]
MALLFAGTAMAEALSFSYGTNFLKPNDNRFQTTQGTSFTLGWNIDSDVSFAVITENTNVQALNTSAGAAGSLAVPTTNLGSLAISGIRVSKGVVKNVTVGLGLGVATLAWVPTVAPGGGSTSQPVGGVSPAVDITGVVNILSGKGDKVSGSLDAVISARFIDGQRSGYALGQNSTNGTVPGTSAISNLNGTNLGLAVTVGF